MQLKSAWTNFNLGQNDGNHRTLVICLSSLLKLHYNSGIYGKEAAQNALIKCGGDEYRSTAILQKDEIKSFYLEVENGDLEGMEKCVSI